MSNASDFRDHFNDVIESVHKYLIFVRAIEYQEKSIDTLDNLLTECISNKEEAIGEQKEYDANAYLCFECIINALIFELKFHISLKKDDIDGAWNHLINAQQAASDAMKAHEYGSHLEGYIKRLYALENLLFPSPVFFSSGFLVKKSTCSICGAEYGECDHIKGRPYMGKMCSRIINEAELREVSVVDDPSDKRCRAISFEEDGVTYNVFTHRIMKKNE